MCLVVVDECFAFFRERTIPLSADMIGFSKKLTDPMLSLNLGVIGVRQPVDSTGCLTDAGTSE